MPQLVIMKEQLKLEKYHPLVVVLYLLLAIQYNLAEILNKTMLIMVIMPEIVVLNSMHNVFLSSKQGIFGAQQFYYY